MEGRSPTPELSDRLLGHLFHAREDDDASGIRAGAYVMSFRSTEFIDDAVRDSESTNKDIADFGWGFGQIDDMRAWYEKLKQSGDLPASANLSVTGYSLGGHWATAFNLLYPDAANKVVTFNGAGIGTISGLTSLAGEQLLLTTMFCDFRELREGARSLMTTEKGRTEYDPSKSQSWPARGATPTPIGSATRDMSAEERAAGKETFSMNRHDESTALRKMLIKANADKRRRLEAILLKCRMRTCLRVTQGNTPTTPQAW